MVDGFVKCAAAGIKVQVADPVFNAKQIVDKAKECADRGAKVIVFGELSVSAGTCGDLFFQPKLITACEEAVKEIAAFTKDLDAILFVGVPFKNRGRLYNVAVAISGGKILGIVPKTYIPANSDLWDARYFTPGDTVVVTVSYAGQITTFGVNQLFETKEGLCIGCEIGQDLEAMINPGTYHAMAGANIVVNLNASCEMVDCMQRRRQAVLSSSDKLLCGYVMASAGEGESTQDGVFGGHHLIAENGLLLAESQRFVNDTVYSDIDISRIATERVKNTSYISAGCEDYNRVEFVLSLTQNTLDRVFASSPFVPKDEEKRAARCEEIFAIQANALKKRMEHTKCSSAVIGVSGGLDSTLAMLVIAKAFDLLGLERSNIRAVTMPCFGTTDRTYDNACLLTKALGATLQEVDIKKAVTQHLSDIGQDMNNHDVTYENAQARERTQVLMDIANQCNGMVIGTGDLSELALGWATYNGDHMSMYGVNGAIPKTLVRHLVRYYADTCEDEQLSKVLLDVLDTPVSPELLPPVDGVISQKTEDLVGPYELHDFFLYYMLRCGFSPAKIYRIAKITFAGEYDDTTILKWLKKFYWRFFSQQFKRSCLPDGPKVGSVGVSPRGDLHMPSDACVTVWINELEGLE